MHSPRVDLVGSAAVSGPLPGGAAGQKATATRESFVGAAAKQVVAPHRAYDTPKRTLCGSRRGPRGSESAGSAVGHTQRARVQSRLPVRSAGGEGASDTSRKSVPHEQAVCVRGGVGCDPDVFCFYLGS